jgi:molybdate transport system permease protein
MSPNDISALVLSFQLAAVTTAILLLCGIPVAWWLARSQARFKHIIEAIIALPLVLPPTVIGFYLLIALGANSPLSHLFGSHTLAFSFAGLVVGSVVYSMPFVIQPLQNAFAAIETKHLEVAKTLRASAWDTLLNVVLPMSRHGIITAAVLGFAHTLGEFGVVLMIGGNIPGKTQVVSIAIYDHVEALEYGQAHLLAGILLAISFVLLVLVYALNRNFRFGKIWHIASLVLKTKCKSIFR